MDASTHTDTHWSPAEAGQRLPEPLRNMLRRHFTYAERQPLIGAAGDYANWLAHNGARNAMAVTTAIHAKRAVVMLFDYSQTRPDHNGSRADVALILRVLGHGIVRQRSNLLGENLRVVHLYYDATEATEATQATTPREPQ